MQKDFDRWNELKKEINFKDTKKTFNERDIFWCNVGLNIGFEEDGKNDLFERPVLVLRKFNKKLLTIIPLSTKVKDGEFYMNFDEGEFKYSVLLSQVRTISQKRLIRYMSRMSTEKFELVKEKYKILFKL